MMSLETLTLILHELTERSTPREEASHYVTAKISDRQQITFENRDHPLCHPNRSNVVISQSQSSRCAAPPPLTTKRKKGRIDRTLEHPGALASID